ncbi:MAG TPA: protein kinase [Bryobacteraceae bacterium]|nr:protein kinase [Bryobacteraceae bacterium]
MPDTIGKYNVERLLGGGGFGKVYLATDPDVGQLVAIKTLHTQGNPDLLKRFLEEIRINVRLKHKNIVSILAGGEEAGAPYLVMEYLEGRTLKQVIQQGPALSLVEKVAIMAQVAEGLAYAHSKGVVHRDVKPENIMLLPDDSVKIMDFGIALAPDRDTGFTISGGLIGTPAYFAPEQLQGLRANQQTDIFSFGDVYYELVTGRHPFDQFKGDWGPLQRAILTMEPPPLGELAQGCPEALETLVHRTLAKSPEFRYQRFEEIQLDSEAILADLRHEVVEAIIRDVLRFTESGDLQSALAEARKAQKLEPGNREVRRLVPEINRRLDEERVKQQVAGLVADSARYLNERRFADAVERLESAIKWDKSNPELVRKLEDAKSCLARYLEAKRLVEEARALHQKGLLNETLARLRDALALDPQQEEARRLIPRVEDEINRRQRDRELRQAIRNAGEHLNARRFEDALAVLDEFEKQQPGLREVADLRVEIQERMAATFRQALERTRQVLDVDDLERASLMIDFLFGHFLVVPGANDTLQDLRRQLIAKYRSREIAQYEWKAQTLVQTKAFSEALTLLAEALRKFPHDPGLEELQRTVAAAFRDWQRSEAIGEVVKEAEAKRQAGDLDEAMRIAREGRRRLGDDPVFPELERQLAFASEQQRYRTGLERLLQKGRSFLTAGKPFEAIVLVEGSPEYTEESEVVELLERARADAAVETENLFAAERLSESETLERDGKWEQALDVIDWGLTRYPNNAALRQAAVPLRDRIERRRSIERLLASIRLAIERRDWRRAERAVREARSAYPEEPAFDDLAAQAAAGPYEDGLQELETRIPEHLESGDLTNAEQKLEAARATYGNDSRWEALRDQVVRLREYEARLSEADREIAAGRLDEAERILKAVADAPDKRAEQRRNTIQVRRATLVRRAEVERLARVVAESCERGDLDGAERELSTARERYPGEAAWDGLQARLAANRQALRRQAEKAAAEQEVRAALGRDDVQQAAALLAVAWARFPGEAAWSTLEREIEARRSALKRKEETAAIAEKVRGWLRLDYKLDAIAAPPSGKGSRPVIEICRGSLERRRDGLRQASSELEGARSRYPGDSLWASLEAEITDRRSVLDAQGEIVERLGQVLDGGDPAQAEGLLADAKGRFPDEGLWGLFDTEIARYRELLAVWAEINHAVQNIRELVSRNDLPAARAALAAARSRYPNEGAWPALESEIAARQAVLEHEAEIAEAGRLVRRLEPGIQAVLAAEAEAPQGTYPIAPVWDVLRGVTARLDQGRAKYRGEAIWNDLRTEAARLEGRIESEIREVVRGSPGLFELDWNCRQLAAARNRYPGEAFWELLDSEVAARRKPLEEASIAKCEAGIRSSLKSDDFRTAEVRLNAARQKHPGVALWDSLGTEIDAVRARVARREELDAVERNVSEQLELVVRVSRQFELTDIQVLQWDAFDQAARMLAEARLKHPTENRLLALESEVGKRRAEWRREAATGFTEVLRSRPSQSLLRIVGPQIRALRTREPGEPLWARLEFEVDAREALLKREAEIAAAGERVRGCLREGDARGAEAELTAARAKYPGEPLWGTLEAEIAERRAEELHRLREAHDRNRDRLLTIERQMQAETRKGRKALDREAQGIAAAHAGDAEMEAIAARIHDLAEAARSSTPGGPGALPWKQVAIGVGAGMLIVLLLWIIWAFATRGGR